jgi:hypothetical protein
MYIRLSSRLVFPTALLPFVLFVYECRKCVDLNYQDDATRP